MNQSNPHLFPIFTGLLLSLGACSPGDETRAAAGMEISLARASVESTDGEALVVLDGEGEASAFSLYSAEIMVRHIQLDLPEGTHCEDQQGVLLGATCEDDKITIEGPMSLDLVAGTATPDLSEVQIPTGPYKRVDVRIDDGDPDEGLIAEGDPLDDYSMSVSAAFDSVEGPVGLELSLKFNEDIRFESAEGIEVSGDGGDLLASLDPYLWFDADVLDDCISSGDLVAEDGVIYLDDDSHSNDCSDVENSIKDNIKESGQLDRQ